MPFQAIRWQAFFSKSPTGSGMAAAGPQDAALRHGRFWLLLSFLFKSFLVVNSRLQSL
jgi:hypothetical protein